MTHDSTKIPKIQQNYPVVPGPIQSQKWQHAYLSNEATLTKTYL